MYRAANGLSEDAVGPWAIKYALLLKLPWLKFVMGCSSYIISVIALSWRALEGVAIFRIAALGIGLMSMSTVLMTMFFLHKNIAPPMPKMLL